MKAIYLTAPDNFELRDIEKPAPGEDEVLIKTAFCGICTLEQRLFRGDMKICYPIIPGHEVSGEVVEVGRNVDKKIKPGAKAAVDMIYRCHECYYCRRGETNLCENRFAPHVSPLGGFAEYIKVKAEQVFIFPDEIPLEYGALTEPAACVLNSLKKIGLSITEDVCIIGAGPMGMLHLMIARAMGARVAVSDIEPARLQLALDSGADYVINAAERDMVSAVKELTSGRGADAAILTSPSESALFSALGALRRNGRLNIFTAYMDKKPKLPLDAETIHRRGIVVTGTEGRTEIDFQQAVRLLAFSKIDVAPLISHVYKADEVSQAMSSALSKETQRVLLEFC